MTSSSLQVQPPHEPSSLFEWTCRQYVRAGVLAAEALCRNLDVVLSSRPLVRNGVHDDRQTGNYSGRRKESRNPESLFPTIRIATKELARLKRDDNRMTKNRKICNSPVITAMNATTHMAAIWTDPMRKITSRVYMIGAHIFDPHLFNRQVTWRIKGR